MKRLDPLIPIEYSKYAFLGALRSAAQMVSYEVSIGLILIVRLGEHLDTVTHRRRQGMMFP